LRILLRDSDQRMPVNDSWIAATALALGVAIATMLPVNIGNVRGKKRILPYSTGLALSGSAAVKTAANAQSAVAAAN
jgi:hypothetical protein